MKLYLTSYRIPHIEALSGLFDRSLDKLEGAILINAKDDKPAEERQQKLAALQTDLAAIGLGSTVLVDLLDHDDAQRIGRQLARFDYLYASLVNTGSLTFVSTFLALAIITLVVFSYVDYRKHKSPITQSDRETNQHFAAQYTYLHYLKVVTFPTLRYRLTIIIEKKPSASQNKAT